MIAELDATYHADPSLLTDPPADDGKGNEGDGGGGGSDAGNDAGGDSGNNDSGGIEDSGARLTIG